MIKLNGCDWEDLHVFLSVARAGSARAAADTLGCHYTRVIRRITAFEGQLGVRLFDRSPKGYELTEAGASVLSHTDQMESEVIALLRKLQGEDESLSGVLRVSMTSTVASFLLAEDLSAFADAHPELTLQFSTNTQFADLERGEAQVIIRVSNTPGDDLVGRQFGQYSQAVYATPAYLARHDLSAADTKARWLHWLKDDAFQAYVAQSEFPNILTRQTIDDELLLLNAARAGMGIATLPCFYADPDPTLVRVGHAQPEPCYGIWLLTHPDLQRNARTRAFMDYFAEALERKRPLLEGQLPAVP
ncbi:MAG: LysR family transcriptional regulator [Thalassovita sp.]